MRWKGLIFIAVIVAIFIGLSFILTDSWLEKQLEKSGQTVFGAKVEIDNLDASIFGLHVKWDSLQIANKKSTMKNLISTGRAEFDVEFLPLLSRKVVVQNVQLTNVQTGMERTTDGKLPPKKKKTDKPKKPNFITKTASNLEADIAQAPAWNLSSYTKKVNTDSILAILKINSPQKIDSVKTLSSEKLAFWETTFKNANVEADMDKVETEMRSIKPQEIKTLTELQSALKTLESSKTTVDSLKKFVQNSRKNMTKDFDFVKSSMANVDDWIKDDYAQALSMAKLPEINKQNMGKFIFGQKVVAQVNQVLEVAGTVREYANKLKSDNPKKEKPPRFKGQDIHFSQKQPVPKYWVKNIELSGQTPKKLAFKGTIQNIVSRQTVIGKPTLFNIDGSRADGAKLKLTGEFNYLDKESPKELFNLNMTGIPLNNVKLSESPFLPNKVDKGVGVLDSRLNIIDETMDSKIKFEAQKLAFNFGEKKPANKAEEIVQKIMRTANTVDFNAGIKAENDKTTFSLNSNLDDLFVREFRNLLGVEVQKAKDKLVAEVNKRAEPYKKQAEDLIKEKREWLEAEIAKYEKEVDEKIAYLEAKKKEVEQRIEDEKKKQENKVKNEATKQLNKLIGG